MRRAPTETTGGPHASADVHGTAWIDELTDEQCMEIFWLYVDPPGPFLEAHAPALLGRAMRYALHHIARADVDAEHTR